MAESSGSVDISVVIPVFNEEQSLTPLHAALVAALEPLGRAYEVLYIDDGSTDRSLDVLRELARRDPRIRVLVFRKNFGQTAALAAGIDCAEGEIIVTLDADLQNDPADIPILIEKMSEGYDIVCGRRKDRRDSLLRRLSSWTANQLVRAVSGLQLHDIGCTLRASKADMLKEVSLYGEMHRFLPVYGAQLGARICEIPVRHHPRRYGKAKYGLERTPKVLLDLLVLLLLGSYITRPIHFFGAIAGTLMGAGFLCGVWVLVDKFLTGQKAHRNPILLLAVFLALLGAQMIMLGLLAELLTRIYHESKQKPIYRIRETIHFA
ncbi:MAG TPA: glycosyltransferase family 2 protein [bacterium]|nr:glycosyltransferase family 2 protein [bacterium]HQL62619.1 glycosyltransferase family 2 protein [bacterium]